MFRSHQREQWDHTTALVATLLNVNRDPKKSEPVEPQTLNPYRKQPKKRELSAEEHAVEMAIMRASLEKATGGRGQ